MELLAGVVALEVLALIGMAVPIIGITRSILKGGGKHDG